MGESVGLFVTGALAMGYAVITLFFARFWRDTHDRLFGMFAAAFALLVLQRVLLALFATEGAEAAIYGLRLLAYVIILAAIVDKNRGGAAAV